MSFHEVLKDGCGEPILIGVNVILGVQFIKVARRNVSGFAIEIFGRHFDYAAGELSLEDLRISRQGSNEKSGKSLSFKAVSTLFTKLPHIVTPSDTKYFSLERSTMKEDFGQSTLPSTLTSSSSS